MSDPKVENPEDYIAWQVWKVIETETRCKICSAHFPKTEVSHPKLDGFIEVSIPNFKKEFSIQSDNLLGNFNQSKWIRIQNVKFRMKINRHRHLDDSKVSFQAECHTSDKDFKIFAANLRMEIGKRQKIIEKNMKIQQLSNVKDLLVIDFRSLFDELNENGGLVARLWINCKENKPHPLFFPKKVCLNGHEQTINKELNDFMSQFLQNCMYFQHGCQEKKKIFELQAHEQSCDYRQVFCPIYDCKDNVRYLTFPEHFSMNHQFLGNIIQFSGETLEFQNDFKKLQTNGYRFQEIRVFNHTFFFIKIMHIDIVHQWIYLYGFKEDCSKFRYEIKCNFKNDETFTHYGEVQPMTTSHKEIIEEGNVLTMLRNKYKNMVGYQISLRNLKEEAKDDNSESGISDNEQSETSK